MVCTMNIPARLLRASADRTIHPSPFLTPRERERRETIINAGRTVMAQFGRHAIKMSDFASAIHISPAAIRRHFADLDNLLATILREHLNAIAKALGAVPHNAPNRQAARRAAYLAATRTALGAPSEAHLLLIRDRHMLPPDEQDSVEAIRDNIGDIIAGSQADLTLAILDTPQIHPSQMEAALAAMLATPIQFDQAEPDLAAAPGPATRRPTLPMLVLSRALKTHSHDGRRADGSISWPSPGPWEHASDLKEVRRRAST